MKSIRTKLILVISLLMLIVFSVTGYVLIQNKTKELTGDIYQNALTFAELTSTPVVEDYQLYYQSQSFSFFNREISGVFALNPDVTGISVLSYQGELLYESEKEKTVQYTGPTRLIQDNTLLARVQDIKPSVLTEQGRVLYLKKNPQGEYEYVDKNERPLPPLDSTERILSLTFPVGDMYRVQYAVSYANLDRRIQETMFSILILMLAAAVGGIVLSTLLASRIVRPLNVLRRGAEELGKGNLNIAVEVNTQDEIRVLADTFNNMARDLRKSTDILLEKERMGKELEIARNIQMSLLPQVPQVPGLDMAAGVVPALEVGGDCFDFIQIDPDRLLIYVGDVTGHGVPSGLVVSMANSLIYAYSNLLDNPRDILIQTNRILKRKTAKDMFITMMMGIYDVKEHAFLSTQAGHDPIYYYNAQEKKLIQCQKGGIALGLVPDITAVLQEEKITMNLGDVIIIYTDGFPESFRAGADDKREILGFERFEKIISQAMQLGTAQEIYNSIVAQTRDFMGAYPQFDDMTLVVMKKI